MPEKYRRFCDHQGCPKFIMLREDRMRAVWHCVKHDDPNRVDLKKDESPRSIGLSCPTCVETHLMTMVEADTIGLVTCTQCDSVWNHDDFINNHSSPNNLTSCSIK